MKKNIFALQEYKTYKENFLKRFQLTKLPPYLIFCIKRFTKNNFFVEKNPTIVNFPITYVWPFSRGNGAALANAGGRCWDLKGQMGGRLGAMQISP